jgi:mannobiose 2-epimerase
MQLHTAVGLLAASILLSPSFLPAQTIAETAAASLPRLETNLMQNIVGFWYPKTVDTTNGGYCLNHDIEGRPRGPGTKMIVTQARMVWLYSRLARAGYGGREYLDAADTGYRFLRDKMWDPAHGGFYWLVDAGGDKKLLPGKHLYGQSFALYALSEYYRASGKQEALDLATRLFNLLEEKAHDKTFGGYLESFNEDWTPVPAGRPSYMGDSTFKLMNTHLHLLESMTSFYRASRLPLARERLLELIRIQSVSVVRKDIGACTDKYRRDWTPVLTGGFARVSYGHDLENIWLLIDACDAAGISSYPLLDLYRALFDYSMKYGYDEAQGGFFDSGPFNAPADNRNKTWWVQAEALVSALDMHRMTGDPKYLGVFQKTLDWVDAHQADWKNGEWFEVITPEGKPRGDKAGNWKAGYHNGRAMIECIERLKARAGGKTE